MATGIRHSVLFVSDEGYFSLQRLAAIIVDPIAALVAICQAAETFTLNINGNCEGGVFFG